MASPPVSLHQLLSWQLGDGFAVAALSVQVVALAAYVVGTRRLSARGRRWPAKRTAAFVAGVVVLAVALVSGVAYYDDKVFVVHVIQHVLVMMVAPPLLALGAPVTLATQAASRRVQSRLVRILRNPVLAVLTTPLMATPLYVGVMYVGFLTSLYPASLRNDFLHSVVHVVMFSVGCLFWWPMIGVDELPHRPKFPVRIMAMFATMPFEAFLGVAILSAAEPIAPEHTLADTHAGGAVFWVLTMLVSLGAGLVMTAQWMRQEERRAVRGDGGASEMRRREIWEAARAAKSAHGGHT